MVTNKRRRRAVATSSRNIYVKEVPKKGRGVFARRYIDKRSTIEVCPALVFSKKDVRRMAKTELHSYYFDWKRGTAALLLGFGSLYNHSEDPNATIYSKMSKGVSRVVALRDIEPDEEITIDYTGGDPERELWFDVKG